ncbi:competence protein ComK [Oceanobacillus sp. CFH 90083]|uniref:competence protein ComK n=1 Tax=Oceanobacillus sp. CFH 90083 TaxID=2592336 RepID=UPI00128D6083|nr:competence protein ComK [Oceanobacillus sp. CFH 90083]
MITNYEITDKTMAILPSRSSRNKSKVFEADQENMLTFHEKPFAIIEQNCMKYFSSYAGRRASVLHHTPFKMKTPIPISSTLGILVFPTHGLSNPACAWIFFRHVSKIVKQDSGCNIIFKDGTVLFQPVSKIRMERQIARCHQLSVMIENSGESGVSIPISLTNILNELLVTFTGNNPAGPQR